MPEQIWRSLDGIAAHLKLPKTYIKHLAKQGYLVSIGSLDKRRFLDPTPEYAERLRLAAILHGDQTYIPPDLSERTLITLREVAHICGWSVRNAQAHMDAHPEYTRYKVTPRLTLYSLRTVRDILWHKRDRKLSKQLAPQLLPGILDFMKNYHAEETTDMPTDQEHEADRKMQRQLEAIVRRSERDQASAKNDLANKIELARQIVQILESAKRVKPPNI